MQIILFYLFRVLFCEALWSSCSEVEKNCNIYKTLVNSTIWVYFLFSNQTYLVYPMLAWLPRQPRNNQKSMGLLLAPFCCCRTFIQIMKYCILGFGSFKIAIIKSYTILVVLIMFINSFWLTETENLGTCRTCLLIT